MVIRDLTKLNGETANLPVRREGEFTYPPAYREMTDWMNSWNQWFDNFFNRSFALTPYRQVEPEWGTRLAKFTPAINVVETDKEFCVTAELPGMDEKDVELLVNKDVLTIKGEKKQEFEDKGNGFYRVERSFGAFQRTIILPVGVDTNKVEANFKKGVLMVTIPKKPELQTTTKKVQIKTEETKK